MNYSTIVKKVAMTAIVIQVGDNSILLDKSINVSNFVIQYDYGEYFEAAEIIPTDKGTLLYFKEDINNVLKEGMPINFIVKLPYCWCIGFTPEFYKKSEKDPYAKFLYLTI